MARLAVLVLAVVMSTAMPALSSPASYGELLRALDLAGYPPDERAPGFNTVTIDGRRLSLHELRGRVVLLTFWATWCETCQTALQSFDGLQRKLGRADLAVVTVNVREKRATVARDQRVRTLSLLLALDEQGHISRTYGVVAVPTTFVIARDGRAIARAVGPRDWTGDAAQSLVRALIADPSR